MWLIIAPILALPFVIRSVLVNHHNKKLIETLKLLHENGYEIKQPAVQEYTKKIISNFIL